MNTDADDQSLAWLAELHGGTLDRVAFEAWLEASPEHRDAFRRADELWRLIGESDSVLEWDPGFEPAADVDPCRAAPVGVVKRFRRRIERTIAEASPLRVAASVAALIAAAAIGGRLFFPVEEIANDVRFATGPGERIEIDLPDGSRVTLGASSATSFRSSQDQRQAVLEAGVAHFDVAHDADRAFIVTAGSTEVRVLGTEFSVRRGAAETLIAVTEGIVEVADLPQDVGRADEAAARLKAGEALSADLSGAFIGDKRALEPEADLSWLEGRFTFRDARLEEVIADMNRQRREKIIIADAVIRELRVSTSFSAEQTDQVLSGLIAAYPIAMERKNGVIVLQSAD